VTRTISPNQSKSVQIRSDRIKSVQNSWAILSQLVDCMTSTISLCLCAQSILIARAHCDTTVLRVFSLYIQDHSSRMARLGITTCPSGARLSHKSEVGDDRAGEHRDCLSDISRTRQLGLAAMKTGKMQSITCSCYTVLVAWVMEEFQRLLSQHSPSSLIPSHQKVGLEFDARSLKTQSRPKARPKVDSSLTRALFCGPLN
jgi:hypothetical protein